MTITKINKLKYENKNFIVEIFKKDLQFIINTTNDFIIVKKYNPNTLTTYKCLYIICVVYVVAFAALLVVYSYSISALFMFLNCYFFCSPLML